MATTEGKARAVRKAIEARTKKSRETYDAEIAKFGRVIRIEPWIDSTTPILHRCLKHGEEHKTRPDSAKAGNGLSCCRAEAYQLEAQKRKQAASEKYDADLAALGRLKRIDPYIKASVKIMHECLIHGEQYLTSPNNALAKGGGGLICCKKARIKEANDEKKLIAKQRFYELMAQRDDLEVIDDYIDAKTPIKFKCLKHNQIHVVPPTYPLKKNNTGGFRCCQEELRNIEAARRIKEAAATYDQRLAQFGRIERIDEYQGNNKQTLHRCLAHDEVHPIRPTNALKGQGLRCCNREIGWDTIDRVLEGKSLKSATDKGSEFYMFRVPNHDGWYKLGISVNTKARAMQSRVIYGELVSAWELSNRRNAVLIETSVLRDKSFQWPDKTILELAEEHGYTEIRKADEERLLSHIQRLVDTLEDNPENWASWALTNLPSLWKWERKVLSEIVASDQTS